MKYIHRVIHGEEKGEARREHEEKELKDERKMTECKRKRNEVENLWDLKWPQDKSNVGTKGGSQQQ